MTVTSPIIRYCMYNLKQLAITNDTSRCEINTVTQADRQEGAEDEDEGSGRQTDILMFLVSGI